MSGEGRVRRAPTRARLQDTVRLSADGHAEVPGDLEARVMHAVFGPEVMAASFVDVLAERDPERLAELGRLVRRKLRDQGRGKEKA